MQKNFDRIVSQMLAQLQKFISFGSNGAGTSLIICGSHLTTTHCYQDLEQIAHLVENLKTVTKDLVFC